MGGLYWAAVSFVSLGLCGLVVLTSRWHARWTGDFADTAIQKLHTGAPPRIGVLPILAALVFGSCALAHAGQPQTLAAAQLLGWMMLVAVPAVLPGLAEDLTKRISPRVRLAGTALAALLAMALLQMQVGRVDIPLVDDLVAWAPVSAALTLLLVCGFTNAMNIVDGLNGLAGALAALMLAATAVAAWQVQDVVVLNLCAVLGLAVLGFLLINWPRGLMFLGDGGAYLIGFLLAQIWILLVARHAELSVWFVMAVAAHPTMETIYSIWRRKFMRARKGSMMADRLHLHSLVYRRKLLPWAGRAGRPRWLANGLAGMCVAGMGGLPMAAALMAPSSAVWCCTVCLAYAWLYVRVSRGLTKRVLMPAKPAGVLSSTSP